MSQKQIQDILSKKEGIEVEYKSAKGGFPMSLWETFSAFANTDGGIIILGIKEKDGHFYPDGLTENFLTKDGATDYIQMALGRQIYTNFSQTSL